MPSSQPVPYITDEAAAAFNEATELLARMVSMAKGVAHHHPTTSGLYLVALVMDAEGRLVGLRSAGGEPLLLAPPLSVADVRDDGVVELYHAEQLISPDNLASIADVNTATVYREVSRGVLPKPVQISSRRVGFKLADVQSWIGSRQRA